MNNKNEVTSVIAKFATVKKESVNNFENVVFIGSSGVGRTHLAITIGISLLKRGCLVILLSLVI